MKRVFQARKTTWYIDSENYIELADYLEKVLYNFSFNFVNGGEHIFDDKFAVEKEMNLTSIASFSDLIGGDFTKMYGKHVLDQPNRTLSSILYFKNKPLKVYLHCASKLYPCTFCNSDFINAVAVSSLYLINAEVIRLSFDFAQIYDYTSDEYIYKIDKNILNKNLIRGLSIKYAKSIFDYLV